MELPLQITFHGLRHSDAIAANVRARAQKLVTRGEDEHESYTDLSLAIGDAFDAIRRRLKDYSSVLRGGAKAPQRAGGGSI